MSAELNIRCKGILGGQEYPDGEFAKTAVNLAQYIQSNYKRCSDHAEFLNLVATCVQALQGTGLDKVTKADRMR
jgi:hypothetical protein